MNKKVNYFFARLIKDNTAYILGLTLLSAFFLFSVIFFIKKQEELSVQSETVRLENIKLKAKVNLIGVKEQLEFEGTDIDKMNKIMSQLVPDSEDYFSIALALEKLSAKTGFIITTYTINLKTSTYNKLALSISGIGDSNSFLNFLEEYNFAGSRLITIDKISYANQQETSVSFEANFYNQRVTSQDSPQLAAMTPEDRLIIKKIQAKTNFELVADSQLAVDYEKKTNPF